MYIRKVKRKCNVRACKNIECFAISKSREAGNTIIICKSCLKEGLDAVDNYDESAVIKKVELSSPPPLFFNHTVTKKEDTSADNEETTHEKVFSCECGKTFKTEKGFEQHMKTCGKKNK